MEYKQNANIEIVFGYIFSILSFLMLPIIFMPMGLIMGLICVSKQSNHGLFIIVLSIILGFAGSCLGGWGLGI